MTQAWQDAVLVARLIAAANGNLGGVRVRAPAGPVRDRWLAILKEAVPPGRPFLRLPVGADDERLAGGIDLMASLQSGRPVQQAGLLAACGGGFAVAAMAERLPALVVSRIAAALDAGATNTGAASFSLIALDEGEGEERMADALCERLAFNIDLGEVRGDDLAARAEPAAPSAVVAEADALAALTQTAYAFGIGSLRTPLLAMQAARCIRDAAARQAMTEADVTIAARLVLAHRATHAPQPPAEETGETRDRGDEAENALAQALADEVIAATRAFLPEAAKRADSARRTRRSAGSGAGDRTASLRRGRPAGVKAGIPRGGARLALLDTLRAAAPWQRLRGRAADAPMRISVDDIRIRRFTDRAAATTILAVDASGSAALERLAEAKGAASLLLADAYVERSEVALIAFRGTRADILLPPTRSLTRAKRALAELPGGGGTPLAAGVQAAHRLAELARSKGRTPFIVLLTDGRANVALDGAGGRAEAERDAQGAARQLRATGVQCVVIDISARPQPAAERLARALGSRYAALPRADAAALRGAIRAATP